jgi:UDP-N-acetylmuramyl tripeptide synthase
VIAGRVALALRPDLLGLLADQHATVVVTGTNGKTTTSHLIVAALGGPEAMAHNAAGSNMPDGAVAALMAAPTARRAVLEIDELHLGDVLGPLRPRVVVLLNLSRDQLDRSSEVRGTADTIRRALAAHPGSTVVANADDPMVVHAVGDVPRAVWVAAGNTWRADTRSCPACGDLLVRDPVDPTSGPWWCTTCTLRRPEPEWWSLWTSDGSTVRHRDEVPVDLRLALPGRANLANATMALAAARCLGTATRDAVPRLEGVREISGRYGLVVHHEHRMRVLLVKNPAGWREAVDVLAPGRPVLVVINSREADGRDVSWLWDLAVDALGDRPVAASGARAADLGVRLGYAEVAHHTEADPLSALARLPAGDVDVLANYTAFVDLHHRLNRARRRRATAPAAPLALPAPRAARAR